MDKSVVDEVMQIRGVKGAALLGSSGKVDVARVEPKELGDFFELLARTTAAGGNSAKLGGVRRVVVRTDKNEDFSLLVHERGTLAVVSERTRPHAELFAEIDELVKKV